MTAALKLNHEEQPCVVCGGPTDTGAECLSCGLDNYPWYNKGETFIAAKPCACWSPQSCCVFPKCGKPSRELPLQGQQNDSAQ